MFDESLFFNSFTMSMLCFDTKETLLLKIALNVKQGRGEKLWAPGRNAAWALSLSEFRKVCRRHTRAPEAHSPRGVRGRAPPGKFLKVRLLESLWSLFPLYYIIIYYYNTLFIHLVSLQQKLKIYRHKKSIHKNSMGGADLPGSRV